jgi:phosphoketolase
MVILRCPKGWTAPRKVDGHYLEGFWRAHQIPLPDVHSNPAHLQPPESRMRAICMSGVRCYRTGLLPRMCDEEPLFRPWVEDAWIWQIAIGDQLHPSPRQPMLLASSPNGTKLEKWLHSYEPEKHFDSSGPAHPGTAGAAA